MTGDRTQTIDRLRQRLLSDAGMAGWGYYAGKASRVEPTCWALLALSGAWDSARSEWPPFAQHHLAFLAASQHQGGLLVETDAGLANLTSNGLALLVSGAPGFESAAAFGPRLRAAVVGVKGVRLPQSGGPQDNQLQGWPWVKDTFSWVEPTAWCLLALKKTSKPEDHPAAAPRVAEAERLLLNRVCAAGGWNYGNASTLGQDLRPYVPTTALGLLAMQDRRPDPAVTRSSEWLTADRLSEPSTIALALTAMALKVYGVAAGDVDDRLMDAVGQSERAGHLLAIAMAAYALSADRHNLEALRVRD